MTTPTTPPKTAKERGKIAPAKFAHTVYRTSRYEEMISWYRTVLEAEAMHASPMATFLTYDEEHHRIAILNMPGLADKDLQAAGVDHSAFTYETLDDLFATYERLAEQNIQPYWCVNHGGTLSMYYRDPDNNQIELQVDVFDSNEAVNHWMANSDFDTNPIGVKFDPEDLIARHRAGEDRETLLTRPRIGPDKVFEQLPSPPEMRS
ncbi:MAG: VOC family protein [Pseudomonadota bacterium]